MVLLILNLLLFLLSFYYSLFIKNRHLKKRGIYILFYHQGFPILRSQTNYSTPQKASRNYSWERNS